MLLLCSLVGWCEVLWLLLLAFLLGVPVDEAFDSVYCVIWDSSQRSWTKLV